MKRRFLLTLFLLLNIVPLQGYGGERSLTENKPTSAVYSTQTDLRVTDAYIYAYPLVLMDITKCQTMGNIFVNRLINVRTFPDPSTKSVVRPSNDLLYSSAWLDLSSGPIIMHLPNFGNRYYLMPLMDVWSNVFASLGTRTTGNNVGDYAIIGPNWRGTLPAGVTAIKSPTNTVWLLGRLYCLRTQEDLKAVHSLQDQITLKPLGSSSNNYSVVPGPFSKFLLSFFKKRTPAEQVANMNAENFFRYFANLLKDNPPSSADAPMVKKLAEIGIVPGNDFNINSLDPTVRNKLATSVNAAQSKIKSYSGNQYFSNGWNINLKNGNYGVDYWHRAYVALILLAANLAEDAIYPSTSVDQHGNYLNGSNRYVLHFPSGQNPPTKAFWSLTVYDNDGWLVDNPLNRYAIHSVDNLKYNKNGSLDIYVQTNSTGPDKESNWLPSPWGNFNLSMRIYWPKPEALNGTWRPPVVQKIN
jgi:DNA sulfur modification protein DndE